MGLTAFNLRQYDGRIGRWLTTDPFGQHHSPYLGHEQQPGELRGSGWRV
ncbi:MAG: hypothetical protein IPH60_08760 [Flavobacteriales bacterium]|nr:hypothetical protein [Flavobacteriales bacterium]